MAAPNPQAFLFSNAGDQHSIVLNKMRERALASILTDDLSLGWWEWSAPPEIKFDGSATFWEGVAQANPSLGSTHASVKLKGIDGGPHKRWSMWFNSMQREEPYQDLTCREPW